MAMKSEMRISKSETNSNDQNSNVQNQQDGFHNPASLIVLDFEHLYFGIVSNFGFRILNFSQKLDSFFQLLPYEDG
jgi:hypothetical protein